jgi:hypothetical protein
MRTGPLPLLRDLPPVSLVIRCGACGCLALVHELCEGEDESVACMSGQAAEAPEQPSRSSDVWQ